MDRATPSSDAPFDLDAYRGTNRLLFVFAPSPKSPPYETQMALFAGQRAAFDARDLLCIEVLVEGESRIHGRHLDRTAAEGLRRRFECGTEDFAVVLVGKDGTEKRRDTAPVRPEAVYAAIDAMPMRQRERRERGR